MSLSWDEVKREGVVVHSLVLLLSVSLTPLGQALLFVPTLWTVESYLLVFIVVVTQVFLSRNDFLTEKIIVICHSFFFFFLLCYPKNVLPQCLSIPGLFFSFLTQDYADQIRNLQKIKEKLENALEKHQDCTYSSFFPFCSVELKLAVVGRKEVWCTGVLMISFQTVPLCAVNS